MIPKYLYVSSDAEAYFEGLVVSLIEKSGNVLSLESAHRVLQSYNAGAILSAANLIVLVPKDLTKTPLVVSPENRDEAVGFLSSVLFKNDTDVMSEYVDFLIMLDYQLMDFWMHHKIDGLGEHIQMEIKRKS